ncbi:MAG TPA: type II secretion system protein [Pirellulales bacterium]|nr:type II secretion system protein [Pirellulales bacterium]
MSTCHKLARQRAKGSGFTLTEMLIVISIIGILASLISVAAYQALQAAKRARTQTEISNMASAIEQFKQKFGDYPPSYLDHRDQNALALMKRFLAKAFPRCNPSVEAAYIPWQNANTVSPSPVLYPFLDNTGALNLWDPGLNTSHVVSAADHPMTAPQSFVFWLTSITKDPVHPLSAPTTDRQAFFDFDTARLSRVSATAPVWNVLTLTGPPAANIALVNNSLCPVYNPGVYFPRDGNQQAYVYFEARCYLFHALFQPSNYPPPSPPAPAPPLNNPPVPYLSQTAPWDLNANGKLDVGVPATSFTPEVTTDASFNILSGINDSNKSFTDFQKLCVNPNSFQIISAGADNDFGTVNVANSAGSAPGVPATPAAVNYTISSSATGPGAYLIYYKSYPDGQGYDTTFNADDDNMTNFTEKTLGQAKP